jgi:ABC-2 type transport system ATP-binding protein
VSDLAKLLAKLYSDPDRIRLTLATSSTGIDPGQIDFQGDAIKIWERILDEAWKRGLVESIIEAVTDEYKESAPLLSIAHVAYLAARGPMPLLESSPDAADKHGPIRRRLFAPASFFERHQEIEALVTQSDLARVSSRLLDFASDCSDAQRHIAEAIEIASHIRSLLRDELDGATEETRARRTTLAGRAFSLVAEITNMAVPRRATPEESVLIRPPTVEAALNNLGLTSYEHARYVYLDNGRASELFVGTDLQLVYKSGSQFRLDLTGTQISLRSGEIMSVLGLNAAGKTTLLRIIAGDALPTAGTTDYPRLQPTSPPPWYATYGKRRRQIAYVRQRPERWYGTLRDQLHAHAAYHGLRGAANDNEVGFVLARLGLEPLQRCRWQELSGGSLMRFELAKALVARPALLVLDEPLAPLDLYARKTFVQDLRDMANTLRKPLGVVLSSQHFVEVEPISDWVLVLRGGRSAYYGPRRTVAPSHPGIVVDLICDCSAAQLLECLSHLPSTQGAVTLKQGLWHLPSDITQASLFAWLAAEGISIHRFRDVTSSVQLLL